MRDFFLVDPMTGVAIATGDITQLVAQLQSATVFCDGFAALPVAKVRAVRWVFHGRQYRRLQRFAQLVIERLELQGTLNAFSKCSPTRCGA